MKVFELIEKLKEIDPAAEAVIGSTLSENTYTVEIEKVDTIDGKAVICF